MAAFNAIFSTHTIRFTVVSIFALATIITAFVAISLQYHFSKKIAIESASQLFSLASDNTKEHLMSIDMKAENITQILAQIDGLTTKNQFSDDDYNVFAQVLTHNPELYAIYIGLENGNFYELINLNASPMIREQLKASYQDRWVTIAIKQLDGARIRTFKYFDESFTLRASRSDHSDYDASSRPWFIKATHEKVFKTPPYLFQHLQAPGQTYSIKIPGSNATLAVDIALSSFSSYLTKQGNNKYGEKDKEIYLFQQSGKIISSNQTKESILADLPIQKIALTREQKKLIASTGKLKVSNEDDWAPIDFTQSGQPKGYSIDYLSLISKMTGLEFEYVNGFTWSELLSMFTQSDIDILQPVLKNNINEQRGLISKPFLNLPYAIITNKNADKITHLSQLNGKTLAIPQGWSVIDIVKEHFPQINIIELASTKAVLEAVEHNQTFAGLDNELIFHYTQQLFFIENIQYHQQVNFSPAQPDSALHFIVHHDQPTLLSIINKAIEAMPSQHLALLKAKWLSSNVAAEKAQSVVPYNELIDLAKTPEKYGELIQAMLNERHYFIYLTPVNIDKTEFLAILTPSDTVFSSSIAKVQLSIVITGICLLLVLPVSWLFSGPIVKPIKLLAIENEKIQNRQYSDVLKVSTNIQEIDALAVSLVSMANAIEQHEQSQVELMDAFIQLIAQTIDDKSPYTGNHCKRVPELGLMLASAAADSQSPPFKDFAFESAESLREFKIAAWLHDCGKIITPEHIVDKGSKLEAIYNRIHEVRMRFEVLWRDAHIQYYQQVAASPEREPVLKQQLLTTQAQLTEDFHFIANCNVGGEFMSDEKLARLASLSTITWQRHFDDTIGLSPVEELNLPQNKPTLPVTEQLLLDKAHHIIARENTPTFDESLGIKMAVPEHQYNLGELYNLSISRGTLTNEDRYKINEHIIGTIKMLEALPFPEELANVPKYASTHHETMIGTGYPRKLSADDLSIPERVLVIADIFEALTAGDRPYKKAKSLSVAVGILHKFALDKHIDIDLFELFLTSGIYLSFAREHMQADQIDDVDIGQYLRS